MMEAGSLSEVADKKSIWKEEREGSQGIPIAPIRHL
jgi:hypothetical protein